MFIKKSNGFNISDSILNQLCRELVFTWSQVKTLLSVKMCNLLKCLDNWTSRATRTPRAPRTYGEFWGILYTDSIFCNEIKWVDMKWGRWTCWIFIYSFFCRVFFFSICFSFNRVLYFIVKELKPPEVSVFAHQFKSRLSMNLHLG